MSIEIRNLCCCRALATQFCYLGFTAFLAITYVQSGIGSHRPESVLSRKSNCATQASFKPINRLLSGMNHHLPCVPDFLKLFKSSVIFAKFVRENQGEKKIIWPPSFLLCCSTGRFKKNLKLHYVIIRLKFSSNNKFRIIMFIVCLTVYL